MPGPPVRTRRIAVVDKDSRAHWIVAGIGVGLLFAIAAFAIGVVSFPLLLDRDVGAWMAIRTSLRAVAANPGTMILWGAIVAGLNCAHKGCVPPTRAEVDAVLNASD